MANIRSAAKAARKGKRREAVNTARKSRVRSFVRKVEEAITKGDAKAAQEALRAAQPDSLFTTCALLFFARYPAAFGQRSSVYRSSSELPH